MYSGAVGILHPGQMGGAVAAALVGSGRRVYWCPDGRSPASARRAEEAGASPRSSLEELLQDCPILLSICPPHGAEDMAVAVAGHGFGGLYADLNAVSPQRAARIAGILEGAGARTADGGIIGPPPVRAGTTRIYLSGEGGEEIASIVAGPLIECHLLGGPPGRASALKMAYAAFTKGSEALGAMSRALAASHGLEGPLLAEWARFGQRPQPGSDESLSHTASVAWRWLGEMDEISDSARAAGLPPEFHQGAARLFSRWQAHRDDAVLTSELLIRELLQPEA